MQSFFLTAPDQRHVSRSRRPSERILQKPVGHASWSTAGCVALIMGTVVIGGSQHAHAQTSPSGPQDIVAVPANAAAASSTPVATPTSEHFASCTGFGCPVPAAAATAPAVVSLSKADNPPAPARVDARSDTGAAAAKILAASFSKGGLPNAASEAKSAPTEEVEMPVGPETLVMRPGVNEIIPISVGQMNRIITPFTHAEVVTASGVQPEIRDSTIYLAPGDDKIITFFVTEKGSEGVALSLTLVPKAIPPREIRLELPTETTPATNAAPPGHRRSTGISSNYTAPSSPLSKPFPAPGASRGRASGPCPWCSRHPHRPGSAPWRRCGRRRSATAGSRCGAP